MKGIWKLNVLLDLILLLLHNARLLLLSNISLCLLLRKALLQNIRSYLRDNKKYIHWVLKICDARNIMILNYCFIFFILINKLAIILIIMLF